jgi:hypothetical protein
MPLFQLSFVGRIETVLSPSVKENYFPPLMTNGNITFPIFQPLVGRKTAGTASQTLISKTILAGTARKMPFSHFFSKTRQFTKWCFRKNHIFYYFALLTVFLHIFKSFLAQAILTEKNSLFAQKMFESGFPLNCSDIFVLFLF